MPQNSKMLIGAVIAAALAFAVYYGLISPQTANTIQTQTNQTFGTAPASQAPTPQTPTTQTQGPVGPSPQNSAPPPRK